MRVREATLYEPLECRWEKLPFWTCPSPTSPTKLQALHLFSFIVYLFYFLQHCFPHLLLFFFSFPFSFSLVLIATEVVKSMKYETQTFCFYYAMNFGVTPPFFYCISSPWLPLAPLPHCYQNGSSIMW